MFHFNIFRYLQPQGMPRPATSVQQSSLAPASALPSSSWQTPNSPSAAAAAWALQQLLQADWRLPNNVAVPYRELYGQEQYKAKCQKKVLKMKKVAQRSNFSSIITNTKYRQEIVRVRNLYPNAGGRENLPELIGKSFLAGYLSLRHWDRWFGFKIVDNATYS